MLECFIRQWLNVFVEGRASEQRSINEEARICADACVTCVIMDIEARKSTAVPHELRKFCLIYASQQRGEVFIMIQELDVQDIQWASRILEIQLPSYRVEAELIGFDGIPALQDTVETLMACGEAFYGYMIGDDLAGAVSYKDEDGVRHFHRLIVDPNHFRKGIGNQLVQYVLEHAPSEITKYIVSTGQLNHPAKSLYIKHGFVQQQELEVGPGVFLTFFEKLR